MYNIDSSDRVKNVKNDPGVIGSYYSEIFLKDLRSNKDVLRFCLLFIGFPLKPQIPK